MLLLKNAISIINQGFHLRKAFIQLPITKEILQLIFLLKKDGYVLEYKVSNTLLYIYLNVCKNVLFCIKSIAKTGVKKTVSYKQIKKAIQKWNFTGNLYLYTTFGVYNMLDTLPFKIGGELSFIIFAL